MWMYWCVCLSMCLDLMAVTLFKFLIHCWKLFGWILSQCNTNIRIFISMILWKNAGYFIRNMWPIQMPHALSVNFSFLFWIKNCLNCIWTSSTQFLKIPYEQVWTVPSLWNCFRFLLKLTLLACPCFMLVMCVLPFCHNVHVKSLNQLLSIHGIHYFLAWLTYIWACTYIFFSSLFIIDEMFISYTSTHLHYLTLRQSQVTPSKYGNVFVEEN